MALKIDPNGRVLAECDKKRMDFKFHTFGPIFESLLGGIREDCIRARTQARTAKKSEEPTSMGHRDKRRRMTPSSASSASDSGDDSDLEDYSEPDIWVPANTAHCLSWRLSLSTYFDSTREVVTLAKLFRRRMVDAWCGERQCRCRLALGQGLQPGRSWNQS